ncbi:MAG: heavy metal translocating P-type ATPase, partial [Candidatus Helarchaeota archaeon]
VIVSGYNIVKEGISNLIDHKITINILMTIAAIGSFLIGHGGEGASVMFLFFIAEFLENYATDRSKNSITSLMKIAPDIAVVKISGSFKEMHTHSVKVGDIIQIKPGNSIPLDGITIKGASTINESSLTGESIPVFKQIGDTVFAGTINFEGYLEVQVTKSSDQTLLAKIKEIIDNARNKQSKTQRFIDKFSKYYTPIMIFLAIFMMLIPPLIFQLPINEWVYKGLIILVISCPCALALSMPISMISALTSGAKNGILIKGGKFIEDLNKLQIIAFDKTGTLTKGSLEVKDIISLNNDFDQWFKIAASLENLSEHPISRAIVSGAEKRGISPEIPIESFKSIIGKGISGSVNGNRFYVGNKSLFDELKISVPEKLLNRYQNEGKTVVLFGNSRQIIGLISLRDTIRDYSQQVIHELKARNIKTIMISGDNKNTVRALQKELGIDQVFYELKPDEKQETIKNLINKNKTVAMVGDGINDAPALASADIGIAMGGIGSDISLETADVILMNDNIGKIITLLDISKKTNKIMKENIYSTIVLKFLFIILTFLGLMTLWMAVGIGDLGITLLVIINTFRISFVKKRFDEVI